MRTMHTPDGDIAVYTDDIGSPCLKCGSLRLPLVATDSKKAGRIRIKQGYALSTAGIFNFRRVLVTPFFDGTDIVFPRANGQEIFRLKVAHG